MHKNMSLKLLVLLALTGASAHAQNAAVDRLNQFAASAAARENARAIGVLCLPGNRLTARLQDDCNNLVGNAFAANPALDTAVRAALASITADNATIPINRSGLGKLSLLPTVASQAGPGWAALLSADQSMLSLSVADDEGVSSDWSLFVNARVNNDQRDRSSNVDGFDRDGTTLTMGFDLRTSSTTHVGAAVIYARNDLDYSNGSGSLKSTDVGVNAFAGWQAGNGFYVDSLLSFNRRDNDQMRRVFYGLGVNQVDQRFDARFDADERMFALTAGFQFARGAATFDPYARVEFIDAESDGYSEVSRNPLGNGGGWALVVDPLNETFTRSTLGVRAAYAISGSNGVYVPFVDLSWVNNSGLDEEAARLQYLGDRSENGGAARVDFFAPTDGEDNSYSTVALGLSAQWANGWAGFVSYRQAFALDRYEQREFNVGLRMEF